MSRLKAVDKNCLITAGSSINHGKVEKSSKLNEPDMMDSKIEFNSRKKSRICTQTSSMEEIDSGDGCNDIDTTDKKSQNDADLSQKLVDLESFVTQCKQKMEKLQKYSYLLEKKATLIEDENKKLKSELESKAIKSTRPPVKEDNKSPSSSSQSYKDDMIQFYETMTSMTVHRSIEKPNEYNCNVKNEVNQQSIHFIIQYSDTITTTTSSILPSTEQIDFIPQTNIEMLPEYLQNHIEFERNMAPVVMGDILQNLYEDKNSEKDDNDDDTEE